MGRAVSGLSTVGVIFRKELLELLRDRRAVFFAFILPLFLYPLLFLGTSSLPRIYQEELETKALVIGLDGVETPFEEVIEKEDALEVYKGAPDEEKLRDGHTSLFLTFEEGSGSPVDGGEGLRADIFYLQSNPTSREAFERVRDVLDRLERHLIESRFAERGIWLRVENLALEVPIDVSEPEERSALGMAKFLPTLLILLLLTGGAFAAIDLVAGEKERHTLETLWVQAVSPGQIVAGKFLVVLVTSIASVAFNVIGLLLTVLFGLSPGGFGGDAFVVPPWQSIALVLLLLLPFAVLSSAVLLAISSFARSYREAQTYLMPLTFVALVPMALAAAPQVDQSTLVLVIPVANVALATREAVVGQLAWLPLGIVFATTSLYAALALRYTSRLLTREEVLLSLESPSLASDEGRPRRAIVFGTISLLIVYYAANSLQGSTTLGFRWGLFATLWGAVLGLAVLWLLIARRSFVEGFALRATPLRSCVCAVTLGFATSFLAAAWMKVQDGFLPFPVSLERLYAEFLGGEGEMVWPLVFFLFALSPGICEEALWRGAFQGDLGRRRVVRRVLLGGLFFGIFHFSVYRFLPTAFVGAVLAGVRHRTGSILPCVLLHTTHNAAVIFFLEGVLRPTGLYDTSLSNPWWILGAAALGVASIVAMRSSCAPRSDLAA